MQAPFYTQILRDPDPREWRSHRFGLGESRWARLEGKTFWITGAGSGFGRSIATALAAGGARVLLSGRRSGKLEETIRQMEALGIPTQACEPVDLDVTNDRQVLAACDRMRRSTSRLDGLVHCAARANRPHVPTPMQSETVEYWEDLVRVNVIAPWNLTRCVLPDLLESPSARVLFLTSGAGWGFAPGSGPYCVSKAALNSVCGCFATEIAATHPDADIQFNALDPGQARTEMNPHAVASPYVAVGMSLLLLSSGKEGPSGKFFDRDGGHLYFATAAHYPRSLLEG